MTTGYKCSFFVTCKRYYIALIAFSVVFGLHTGVLLCVNSESLFHSLIPSVLSVEISLAGSLSLSLIPFFLCAVCIHAGADFLIPVVLAVKAICFGFSGCLTYRGFGSAGWLVHWILFFFHHIQFVLLILFCLRFGWRRCSSPFRGMMVYFVASACLCFADYVIIVPFLAEII